MITQVNACSLLMFQMHLVHYSSDYGSVAEAADKTEGLAVLGVFIEVPIDWLSYGQTLTHAHMYICYSKVVKSVIS